MATEESRRNEYWARINRAVDYIDRHLGEEMTLRDIAAAAFFSPFHFHRIFRALMGEPVSQFVQRVRLEKAASLLKAHPRKTVTRIALECGYQNPAAFSRAFKSAFGCSPSEWRRGGSEDSKDGTDLRKDGKETSHLNAYPPGRRKDIQELETRRREMAESLQMDVRVEDLPEATVAYVRHVGPYAGNQELFRGLFEKIFTWAGARDLIRFPDTQVLSIYHDDPGVTDESKLRTSVGITVPPDTETSGEVGKLTIPAGKYAQARFELSVDQYPAAWEAVCGEWLPKSGYEPDDGPAFERCLNDPEEHPEKKFIVDICIPVKPL